MQTKLHKFFEVKIQSNTNNMKYFIYDPDNYKASFENAPHDSDIFVVVKCGVKLYYRPPIKTKAILMPKIQTQATIPLLKSNLQKAIRRCQTHIAVNSALAIIQKDPIELLRRLPIIYIEDVCLMDTYSIPVWLMMTEKEHVVDLTDTDILLNIVKQLCECALYYDDSVDYTSPTFKLAHHTLKEFEHKDSLLSLFYRSQYGGMKCDIKMLTNSIYYYRERPSEIQKSIYDSIDYVNFDPYLPILPEAVDFHPFPQIITILNKQTTIDNNDIKMYIWYSESGVNTRKPFTVDKSREYSNTDIWKTMKPKLDQIRSMFINNT